MAVVKCGEFRLPKSFDDGEHGRIHESDVSIIVARTQFTNPNVVVVMQFLDAVGARDDVIEQCDENAGVQPLVDPVVHLHQYGGWDYQRLGCRVNECSAGGVVLVVPIKRCEEWACIEN